MVLPIAVGGKSCSSRRVLGSSLLSTTKEELLLLSLLEEEEQEKEFEAIPLHDNGLVGVFVCSQQILSATVAITYYELRNRINHKLERTVAQIMIQVSPLSKPLSESQYRRVIHRIVLPSDDNLINNGTPNQQPPLSVTTTTTSIDALFSENRKYLVVRIPHPQQSQPSIGVIFQLRRPRAGSLSTKASLLQPPSYITHDPAMMDARNIIIPVATNPTIIALPDDDNDNNNKNNNSLKHVVGFCQVSTPYSAMLLLLVTCLDGTIRVVSWKQASVAGTLYQSPSPVVRIRHTTTSSSSGRLAMLNQQGQVTILTTKWETHTEAHMMTADEQQEEPFSGQDQQSEEGVLVNGVETHDAHPTNDHVEENEKLSPEADEDDGKSWEEVTDETTTEPNPTRNGDAVDPPSSLDKSNGLAPSEIRETSQTHQDGPVTVETPESRTKDPMMIRLALHFHSTLSGSFADCAWIHDDALALLAAPQSKGDCVAKVWSLNNAKAITALSLTAERLEEIAHGTFDVNDNDENHDEAKLSYGSLGLQSLRYDSLSGCLAVSSLLHPSERALLFSCVWNWRSNVVGFTLQSKKKKMETVQLSPEGRVMSQLMFATDGANRRFFVHMTGNSSGRLRKQIMRVALLSPQETVRSNAALTEPTPFMVSSQTVTFPVLYKTSCSNDTEMEWRESRIPQSYLNTYGAPLVAAMGRRMCRSIAVASAQGMCVLDCSRLVAESARAGRASSPKWRMFGESEEREFRVLCMSWWEGVREKQDDLLLAVIETEEGWQKRKTRYLSCWSRRRLDMSHQLLTPTTSSRKGIQLPQGFVPDSISLLVEPLDATMPGGHRRSVLCLTSVTGDCTVFQLQQVRDEEEEVEDRPYVIQATLAWRGSLPPLNGLGQSSTFLASASFGFDLTTDTEGRGTYVATLCFAHSSGCKVVVLSSNDTCSTADLVNQGAVSSYFLSDVIVSKDESDSNAITPYFVWCLLLIDGSQLCWYAPFLTARHEESGLSCVKSNGYNKDKPEQFQSLKPVFVQGSDSVESIMGGSVARVGEAAMWLLGSPQRSRSTMLVGCVPGSSNYLLQTGQASRNLHCMVVSGDLDASAFADNFLEHEIFSVKDGSMSAPAFLPALISHLLSSREHICEATARHFAARLKSASQRDCTVVAMRLLVLRAVEWVTNEPNSSFASNLFCNVVHIIRASYPKIHVARLIVGIARQVEPGCMPNLFPLPESPSPSLSSSNEDLRSIADLYDTCLAHGSLSVSSMALPLLNSRMKSLEECHHVLYHCLRAIVKNQGCQFDFTMAERYYLRDLFRFGTQLEDLDETEFWSDDPVRIVPTPVVDKRDPVGGDHEPRLAQVRVEGVDSREGKQPTKSFVSRLFPRSIVCSGRKNREERQVYEAASDFIVSGFEESDYVKVITEEAPPPPPIKDRRNAITWTVSRLLAKLCLETTDGWKLAASISGLLLERPSSLADVLETNLSCLEDWGGRLTPKSIERFVERQRRPFHVDEGDDTSITSAYTSSLVAECRRHLDPNEALLLFNAAITLLSRMSTSTPNNDVATAMMMVVVGTGCAVDSGFTEKLPDRRPWTELVAETKKE